jgi:hypothetical protein
MGILDNFEAYIELDLTNIEMEEDIDKEDK